MKRIFLILASITLCLSAMTMGCSNKKSVDATKPNLTLSFSYAERLKYPPSYSVWIEDESGNRQTLYVTRKVAANKWGGAKRPSVLPIWSGVRETDVDIVSEATPTKKVTIQCNIPERFAGNSFKLYIEANASFDYNDYYKQNLGVGEDGFSDVNGQPSMLWETELDPLLLHGEAIPSLIGTGDVLGADNAIHNDLSNVTTAKNLLIDIKVKYDFIK